MKTVEEIFQEQNPQDGTVPEWAKKLAETYAAQFSNTYRFLLFYGNIHYAKGGADDLLSKHNTIEEAMAAFNKKVNSELEDTYFSTKEELMMYFRWAHIYDSNLEKVVWSSDVEFKSNCNRVDEE